LGKKLENGRSAAGKVAASISDPKKHSEERQGGKRTIPGESDHQGGESRAGGAQDPPARRVYKSPVVLRLVKGRGKSDEVERGGPNLN